MKYLLFGAGRIGCRMLELLGERDVLAFIDNKKAGSQLEGKTVFSLGEALRQYPEACILISIKNQQMASEVAQQLKDVHRPFVTFEAFFLRYLQDIQSERTPYYQAHRDAIDYMVSRNRFFMLPAPFYDTYADREFAYQEEGDGLVSFLRNGKKVYLPKDLPNQWDKNLSEYIRSLFAEQDAESPHQYFDRNHFVTSDDTFVDVGGAEAMSSVDLLDRAKRIVIFEGDDRWLSALAKTFASYGDRVTIVPKYVGTIDDDQTVRIDTYFANTEEKLFFKVDIEGSERAFLQGAEKTLERQGTKISICTYHNLEDAEDFQAYFRKRHYVCSFSQGEIFTNGWFVKGVLRAEKEEGS